MKDIEFQWTLDCLQSFDKLKKTLTNALVLRGPNWKLPFHIHTSASDFVIGAILGQKNEIRSMLYIISKKTWKDLN
jgi:hypothetical protein